jgi:hypothetical protein
MYSDQHALEIHKVTNITLKRWKINLTLTEILCIVIEILAHL